MHRPRPQNRVALIATVCCLQLIAACRPGGEADSFVDRQPPRRLAVRAVRPLFSETNYEPLLFFGTVEPERRSELTFTVSGQVAEVFKRVGETVEKDETIATLSSEQLESQRDDVEVQISGARQELDQLRSEPPTTVNLQREQQLNSKMSALERGLADLETQLDRRVLTAPFAGVIGQRSVDAGDLIQAGRPAVVLLDTDRLRFVVDAPLRAAEALAVGDAAWATAGDDSVPLRIVAKAPMIEPASRTVVVELEPAAAADVVGWVIGELVEIRFWRRLDAAGWWVPLAALQRGAESWRVLTARDEDPEPTLVNRPVEVLRIDDGFALVRADFAADEVVVADGLNRIVEGQRVELQIAAMQHEASTPPEDEE